MNIKPDARDELGQWLRVIQDSRPLSADREAALAPRIRAGDEQALAELVFGNLRFVIRVAKEYQYKGLTIGELISAGHEGLVTAAMRFDESRGFKFITYAVWWIRQAIQQALAEQNVVRLPANKVDLLRRINEARPGLREQLGRNPFPDELSSALDEHELEIDWALRAGQPIASLDSAGEGSDAHDGWPLVGRTADASAESPDAHTINRDTCEQIQCALACLDDREREIVWLFFGLDGEEPMTLAQIGLRFGFTRERARQLRNRALGKLRDSECCAALRAVHEG